MPELFQQDPHKVAEFSENDLCVAVGRQARAFRRQKGMTKSQLAKEAGISNGMLSKVENGQIAPSLQTLQSLSQALSVPLTALFKGFEETREAMHVKSGEGVESNRAGTRSGHQYSLLANISGSAGVTVEPYLINLTVASDGYCQIKLVWPPLRLQSFNRLGKSLYLIGFRQTSAIETSPRSAQKLWQMILI